MKAEVWKAKDGWRWRIRATNGRLVAESGEAYSRRYSARRALYRIAMAISNV